MTSLTESIPTCTMNSGPHGDKKLWESRVKEEYAALIAYIRQLKSRDAVFFSLKEDGNDGVTWSGECWQFVNDEKHTFKMRFTIPASYPSAPPDIILPELERYTTKMWRGGRICTDDHFIPLWRRNVPRFGLAHALAYGLSPWLAVEVPLLVSSGILQSHVADVSAPPAPASDDDE